MIQILAEFKKLEKKYMHYKIKLWSIVNEHAGQQLAPETDRKSKERIERVGESDENVSKFKVSKEAIMFLMRGKTDTVARLTEKKNALLEKTVHDLSEGWLKHTVTAYKSRIQQLVESKLEGCLAEEKRKMADEVNKLQMERESLEQSRKVDMSDHLKTDHSPYKISTYQTNARALVNKGDRQSLSNSESELNEDDFKAARYNLPMPNPASQAIAEGFKKSPTFGTSPPQEKPKDQETSSDSEKEENRSPVYEEHEETDNEPKPLTDLQKQPSVTDSKPPVNLSIQGRDDAMTPKENRKIPTETETETNKIDEHRETPEIDGKKAKEPKTTVQIAVKPKTKESKPDWSISEETTKTNAGQKSSAFENPWMDASIPEFNQSHVIFNGNETNFMEKSGTGGGFMNFESDFSHKKETSDSVNKANHDQSDIIADKKAELFQDDFKFPTSFKKKDNKKEIKAEFGGFFEDSGETKGKPAVHANFFAEFDQPQKDKTGKTGNAS